jgi:hypothetical protein
MKPRMTRWAEYIACMREVANIFKVLLEKY